MEKVDKKHYLFSSERLGFRNWRSEDIPLMAAINADPLVMEFFPGAKTYNETKEFITRMQKHQSDYGFCYFAVDKLNTGKFIGFIGLCNQTFEAQFTPCIDIGWRLSQKEWNKGLATEGAKICLEYAFNNLKLDKVNAMAPLLNFKSIEVMKKIGMKEVLNFKHPLLTDNERLVDCVLYEINNKDS